MTGPNVFRGALCALLLFGPAHAQDGFETARDDGKSFAAGMAERVQDQTAVTPTAETVPNYAGDELPQGAYFDDPDRIEADAAAAKSADSGYRVMDTSMRSRATFDPATINETIARSNLINEDPARYAGGMSVTGTEGSCTKLPATEISPGSYIATCNRGLKLEGSAPSCPVTRNVTVGRVTTYRYECSAFNATFNGTDSCDLFAGRILQNDRNERRNLSPMVRAGRTAGPLVYGTGRAGAAADMRCRNPRRGAAWHVQRGHHQR